jgi:hypothetical protein
MSPSESDLRAALQHGEEGGFQVNADAIMREGQAIRGRRVRILSGTAAAVLVAAGAVGLAATRGGNGASNAGGGNSNLADKAAASGGGARHGREGNAPGRAQAPAPSPLPSGVVPTAPVGGTAQLGAQCPASAPHLLTPGGGGTGQFGADEALFAKPVKTLVVCSYATTVGSAPGRLVLSHHTATEVVSSMETATPKSTAPTPCDAGPTSTTRLLDFIGVTSTGSALPPVTATLTFPTCNVRVTNGTAVRYNWSPPANLTDQLRGLSPPKVPPIRVPSGPSGIVNGSPVRS